MCVLKLTPIAPLGYELTGSCGERLTIGASQILTSAMLPACCEDFRRRALAALGPGGNRMVDEPIEGSGDRWSEEAWDGFFGLGRKPNSKDRQGF